MTRTKARFLSLAILVLVLGSAAPALADPTTDQDLPDGYTGVPDEIQTRVPQRTPPEPKGGKQSGGQTTTSTTLSVESTTSTRLFRYMLEAARQEIWILLARH